MKYRISLDILPDGNSDIRDSVAEEMALNYHCTYEYQGDAPNASGAEVYEFTGEKQGIVGLLREYEQDFISDDEDEILESFNAVEVHDPCQPIN